MMPVHDLINPKRLLGYLPRRKVQGKYFRMAICEPMSLTDMPYAASATVSTVDFEIGWNEVDEWTMKKGLRTASPLSDLLKLRDFRLPEETERMAHERHWMRGL